jgi:hypothetical protein
MTIAAISTPEMQEWLSQNDLLSSEIDQRIAGLDQLLPFENLTLAHKLHIFREASFRTLDYLREDGNGDLYVEKEVPCENKVTYLSGLALIQSIFHEPITSDRDEVNTAFDISSTDKVINGLRNVYRPILEKVQHNNDLDFSDLRSIQDSLYPRIKNFNNSSASFPSLPGWMNLFLVQEVGGMKMYDDVTLLIETALTLLATVPENRIFHTANALYQIPHELSQEYISQYNELKVVEDNLKAHLQSRPIVQV